MACHDLVNIHAKKSFGFTIDPKANEAGLFLGCVLQIPDSLSSKKIELRIILSIFIFIFFSFSSRLKQTLCPLRGSIKGVIEIASLGIYVGFAGEYMWGSQVKHSGPFRQRIQAPFSSEYLIDVHWGFRLQACIHLKSTQVALALYHEWSLAELRAHLRAVFCLQPGALVSESSVRVLVFRRMYAQTPPPFFREIVQLSACEGKCITCKPQKWGQDKRVPELEG